MPPGLAVFLLLNLGFNTMIQIISFLRYHFSTEKQNKNKRTLNHQVIYSQSYSLSERCHVPDCAEDTLVTGRALP